MSVTYYLSELERLLSLPETVLPMELLCTSDYPPEYIHCSVCSSKRFGRAPSFLLFRICIHCKALLLRSVMKHYLRNVDQYILQEMKKRVHAQLMDYCYHPQYILKTGLIETRSLFLQ